MENIPYTSISGTLIIVGKNPDGDSVRFRPNNSADLRLLHFAERLRMSKDGTVQLRLDGIDAPETHYQGKAQPLGKDARDMLLQALGFSKVTFSLSGIVQNTQPPSVPATIAAKMVEVHGRPVAYLFTDEQHTLKHGRALSTDTLRRSANAQMLQLGLVYPTLYTSTPVQHRRFFTQLAAQAKIRKNGVWAKDKTAEFRLKNQASIGPKGQLILPKLFRRCTDYLRAKTRNEDLSFLTWLTRATSEGMSEDDELLIGTKRVRLSSLIQENNDTIRLTANLLDIVFIEK